MKSRKRIKSGIVFTITALFVLVTILAAPVYADPATTDGDNQENSITEPLDFVADPSTRDGAGWKWDEQSSTLSLNGIYMELTGDQTYDAAIKLPGASTITVEGTNLLSIEGKPGTVTKPVGIYADGAMTIKGNGMLQAGGDLGVNGIQATGAIQIGEGDDPEKGVQVWIKGADFSIYTEEKLSVNGAFLYTSNNGKGEGALGIKGGVIVGGHIDEKETYAVSIQDSEFTATNTGHDIYGVVAFDKSVLIDNSSFRVLGDLKNAENISGIRAFNGNVEIKNNSKAEMKLQSRQNTVEQSLITVEKNLENAQPEDHPSIKIEQSTFKGAMNGEGFCAPYGDVSIAASEVKVTVTGNALHTVDGSLIGNSTVMLTSIDDGSAAVNTAGVIDISDSAVYMTGKGRLSSGLYTTSEVKINGQSWVDMEGTCAAVQMIANPSAEMPPIILGEGIENRMKGEELQFIDANNDKTRIYSYAYQGDTLAMADGYLTGAANHVVFSTEDRLIFLDQPQDQIVSYPDGANFMVLMSDSNKVASYQWYVVDFVGNEFELDGASAASHQLIVPSTLQEDNELTFYCKVTDTDGNVLISKDAFLDTNNKNEDKTVLYVGNYALEPGESLNLAEDTEPIIGSGVISFAENGTDIVMDNVKMDNSKAIYDTQLSPAMCIRLDRYKTTDKLYTVTLKGENEITNYYYDPDYGNGITVDFMFRGEQTEVVPTVVFDGETEGGTLSIKGGTNALRCIADMVINADITVTPNKEVEKTSGIDGVVSYEHDMTIGANHKLDITSCGYGLMAYGTMTIGENTRINLTTTMPYIDTKGGAVSLSSGIYAGKGKFEVKPKTEIDIRGIVDPGVTTNVAEFAGIFLDRGTTGMVADDCKIAVSMEVLPGEKGAYVSDIQGIYSSSDVNLKDSTLSLKTKGDQWALEGAGLFSDKNVTIENCEANIAATADNSAFGIALNGNLKVKDSKIESKSECVGNAGSSYAVATGSMSIDLSKPEYYVKADATNADGIAFVADTGDAGSDERKYDPSYKATLITGDFAFVSPEKGAVNIASIPGSIHDYMYVEAIYDTQDTSKPASIVELAGKPVPINNAEVNLSYKSTTYTGKAQKPDVTVKLDGKTLKNGKDYKVTYANNVNAGTATVTVKGQGNYSGSKKANFTIKQVSIAAATLEYKSIAYTGKALKPAATVKAKVDGKATTLKAGTDYKITYTNNINVGTATATITGKGNYKGTLTRNFKITKAANNISKITPASTTLKYSVLKKQAQAFKIKAADKFGATLTYALDSATSAKAKKYITISKAGKVTVKKATPTGTYTVKVKISAAGTANYTAKTVTRSFKIIVK